MSKNDPSGLLSKVVSFVRRPSAGWSEPDALETDRDSHYNKQMLKEMIERKRRNDFVRRREFDQLRKLRHREAVSGEEATGRQSLFQSSMPSRPDDRAITLKKIDEIEAQMSMQWWKTKQGMDSTQSSHSVQNGETDGAPRTASAGREKAAVAASIAAAQVATSAGHPEVVPVQEITPGTVPVMPESPTALPPAFLDDELDDPLFDGRVGSGLVYLPTEPAPIGPPLLDDVVFFEPAEAQAENEWLSPSVDQPYAADPAAPQDYAAAPRPAPAVVELPAYVHRPELEEAAIRFANGDHAGAESGLLQLLEPASPYGEDPDIWMTLLDLYRATGQHDRFDNVAIDFAVRFGRSAPLWFSLPEMLGLPFTPAAAPTGFVRTFQWMSPIVLASTSVTALQVSLARAPTPWMLNWRMLKSMDSNAVRLLADQFVRFADLPVPLHFIAADNLDRVIREQTVAGDATVDMQWWRMRMEMLRMRGRVEEFESVALDYCITYEVSPPSWQDVQCEYLEIKEIDTAGTAVENSEVSPVSVSDVSAESSLTDSYPQSQPAPLASVVELSGHIIGDAQSALAPLGDTAQPGRPLVIACDRLARVDFSAAGSVLNWAADQQAAGCQVHFVRMPRLVAVFFNIIGINEHAKVFPRKD